MSTRPPAPVPRVLRAAAAPVQGKDGAGLETLPEQPAVAGSGEACLYRKER